MILYTDEARESWEKTAHKLKVKITEISGDQLSVLEAAQLASILSMFCEYVDKEDREVKGTDHRAKRKAHRAIVSSVVKELHDKNPDLDTIKMCVRMAIAGSHIEWTTDELIEMTHEIADAIPFDPLSPCKLT